MPTNPPVTLLFVVKVAEERADEFVSLMRDAVGAMENVELVETQKAGFGLSLKAVILDDSPMADPAYR